MEQIATPGSLVLNDSIKLNLSNRTSDKLSMHNNEIVNNVKKYLELL